MLEKTEKYTSIDMGEDGQVSLRLTTIITDNGEVISTSHHRQLRGLEDSLDDLPEHISGSIALYRSGISV
jgi:hypothetical protein